MAEGKGKKLDLRKLDILSELGKGKQEGEAYQQRAAGRVPTGIPGLDELIEGGFEKGSVILVVGDTGTGKSTFAMQYLYNGATKYKEPGVYLTFEEK
ncbi:MAG: ATPase domain-containing protein, partial [Candidatus Micrarchaeota archaeon]